MGRGLGVSDRVTRDRRCPAACGRPLRISAFHVADYCGSVSCWKKGCGINMALREAKFQATETVSASNEVWYLDAKQAAKRQAMVQTLGLLFVSWLDGIASGQI